MRTKPKLKFLSLLVVVMFLFTLIIPIKANESNLKTIKVAISDTPYLSQKQSDGSYEGIVIDYLNEISKYAGWKLEYVGGPIDELIKKLQDGEVDLMGGVLKNSDTEKIYDFATFSSGFSYGALITKQTQEEYISLDYSTFKGIKVGVYTKSSSRITDFNEYCKTNQFSFDKVNYDNISLLKKDFDDGKIDAILSNDMSCREDEKILLTFSMTPFYFAVPKGESEILNELNNSLATLQQVSPQFSETSYNKHVLSKRQTDIFTSEEKSFIKSHDTLKIAIVDCLSPSQSWDDKTNKPAGIAPDIVSLIAQKTNLKFDYTRVSSLTEAREMLKNNTIDIMLRPTGASLEEHEFVTTKSYLDTQSVKVYHLNPNDSAKGKQAILEGYHEIPKEHYNVYKSMSECVDAVINGDVESLTTSSLLLENYPSLKGNKRLFLSPIPNNTSSSQFLMRDTAPTLISIFDKSIQCLTQEQINEIVYRNTVTQTPTISLFNLYELYPTEFAWSVAILLFIIGFVAILLLLLNKTRLRLAHETIVQEESYRIVNDLSGEQIFFYDFNTHKLTLPDSFSNVLGVDKVQTIEYQKENSLDPLQKLLNLFFSNNDEHNYLEFSCLLKDGSEGWFRAIGTVLPNSNGKPIRGIGGLKSIQKEKHQLKQLEKQATTDYLTNLSNRQHCESLIRESFNINKNGALLIIDIDHFKQINDKMGHDAGDLLLREFSELLQKQFSSHDIFGRWGGDEFIAFIQNINDCDIIAEKVDTLCKKMNHEFTYNNQKTILSISVGVAISDGSISYEKLFQKADRALYKVKSSTRNNFCIDNDI